MRGKETPSLVVVRGSRITPAYAGKSLPEELEQALPKDHPRVCGEKACMQCTLQGHGGSPPRMRGKGRRNGRAFPGNGITPAYAGKSGHAINPNVCGQDHPRVCGEKQELVICVNFLVGSPPRMRGKVVHFFGAHLPDGITPAYAGKSSQTAEHPSIMQDHPRVCGEKSSPTSSHRKGQGSPPRMRGKALAPAPTIDIIGITPAYAGKSRILSSFPTRFWDHPRVCGEKFTTLHGENDFWGSPPRMRGKACGLFQLVESPGITPAYAGKREGPKNAQSKVGDHPRVCGEKEICRKTQNIVPGSPPRMRGKGSCVHHRDKGIGITPAYAGKSSS